MKFKQIEDPDYGLVLRYPDDWIITQAGTGGVWAFKNRVHDVAIVIFYISQRFSSLDVNNLAEIALISGLDKKPERTEVLEKIDKKESITVKARLSTKDGSYIFWGFLVHTQFSIKSQTVLGSILSSIIFDESYIGTDIEPSIARIMVHLPSIIIKKESKIGLDANLIRIEYFTNSNMHDIRWTASIPNSLMVNSDMYGFTAYSERIYISVKAHHLFISLKDFADYRLSEIYHNQLNSTKFKVITEKVSTNQIFYHTATLDNIWRVFGYWNLQTYYNVNENKQFKMALEKVAIYPSRAEIDALPMISKVFTSFTPGPYWLYEDLGLSYMPTSSTFPTIPTYSSPPKISSQKITTIKRRLSSSTDNSYKRWQNKIKEDLKKLADWEKDLWVSTYQTIKTSDVITGMYSLEDKRGKTRLITTKNIASPLTHNLWKPKQDTTWAGNIILATKKPFVPKNRYLWEKLSWHWDNEIRRINEEYKQKKKKIDTLW